MLPRPQGAPIDPDGVIVLTYRPAGDQAAGAA